MGHKCSHENGDLSATNNVNEVLIIITCIRICWERGTNVVPYPPPPTHTATLHKAVSQFQYILTILFTNNCMTRVRTVADRALTTVHTAYVLVLFVPTQFFLQLALLQLACGFCLCILKRNSLLYFPKTSRSCLEN